MTRLRHPAALHSIVSVGNATLPGVIQTAAKSEDGRQPAGGARLEADKTSVGHPDLMADVNAHVHALAERLDPADDDAAVWGFRCECGGSECNTRVELSVREYETLRRQDESVLAPGHAPLPPPAA